jgi:hypothetical protein
MRRREFIILNGVVAGWSLAVRAQQSERMRRVGVLMAYAENDSTAQSWLAAFREQIAPRTVRWHCCLILQQSCRSNSSCPAFKLPHPPLPSR